MAIEFELNGESVSLDVDPAMPLLWAIRDIAGLTGTKFGCGKALCGTCTVHINGQPVRSCVLPASAAEGASVTTIEGLTEDGNHPVQVAWRELNVSQCGYCQPGQIMSAVALLERAHRCRYRRGNERQHLSMRYLHENSQGDTPCCGG